MIYGIIPIGGKGLRLGLPFSKEMLPQKGFNFYNPIANHLVEKMLSAGADKIFFIHGSEFKADVMAFFKSDKYCHLQQLKSGFAQVLESFIESIIIEKEDTFLFGMPDTIFDGNPFLELLKISGTACSLSTTNSNTKVDRLDLSRSFFHVKSEKRESNSDYFWGLLKFDGEDFIKFKESKIFLQTSEVGDVLNSHSFTCIYAGKYIDLGTWDNYNTYLTGEVTIL